MCQIGAILSPIILFYYFMRTLLAMLGPLALVACFVAFWIVALVSMIRRNDLKHDKLVWILVLFLVPLGHVIYFFMEDRKSYGVWSLVLPLLAGGVIVTGFVLMAQNF